MNHVPFEEGPKGGGDKWELSKVLSKSREKLPKRRE